jgi:hypothetical protein
MRVYLPALLTMALFAGACSKSETPEAQLRALVAAAEVAAEKKEIGVLRGMVSDHYADSQGQDKRAVEGVLRFYFLRNQSIHLLTRTSSVTFPEKDRALAVVYVGMAAQPVTNVDELERLRADLFRFEITFVKEDGDWRARSAEWRRVEFTDFTH